MKKNILAVGLLVCLAAAALYAGGIRHRNKKIATRRECALYKAKVPSKFSLEAEKTRLESIGLDVDFSPQGERGDGTLRISSSRLDHEQVSCGLVLRASVLIFAGD